MFQKIKRNLRFDWPVHFLLILTNWLPDNTYFLRLRGALLRPFLGNCGRNLKLGRNITFYNPKSINLGNNVYIAQGNWFMAGEKIQVEDEVLIGPYCVIVSSDHLWNHETTSFSNNRLAPISIGRGSWIAAHVTVTAGAEIGSGCLIAAGAVVVGLVPSGSMAGGIPARVIKNVE